MNPKSRTQYTCFTFAAAWLLSVAAACGAGPVISLDGEWLIAADPRNAGRDQHWSDAPPAGAKQTKVPWVIQDAFPTYHGVAWYWRDFTAPARPAAGGRTLLRFWAVDYSGDVWLNGKNVGRHEGGETPFALDVTDTIRDGAVNHLAVRVLNPTHQVIDGVTLDQTPHQARVMPYWAGAAYNHGGITGSVELLTVSAVRVEDLYARPDLASGTIRVKINVRNAGTAAASCRVDVSTSPAPAGATLGAVSLDREFPPGDSLVEAELKLDQPHAWDVNDPYLYRVTAAVRTTSDAAQADERTVRVGFRDFRFENGYFRLNGRRLFLRSTHTCNHFPVGLKLPPDPDMARRDLIDLKAMGFNMVRFIWGGAERYQLDLCDEIGLMVYEESFASSGMSATPQMGERFDRAVSELIRRDRNHPAVVIWGLLNESQNVPAFHHATGMLPLVRGLDDATLVFLNAGRFDDQAPGGGGGEAAFAQLDLWHGAEGREPWITHNPAAAPVESPFGFAWAPGQVVLHPGEGGSYSAARWTAPAAGAYAVEAVFTGMAAPPATTDVHVLHAPVDGKAVAVFNSLLNLEGKPNEATYAGKIIVAKGDTLDFAVGYGNGSYGSDSTALQVRIKPAEGQGKGYDLSADFSRDKNPAGPWSYGTLAPGPKPDSATFALYTAGNGKAPAATPARPDRFGSVSNPGSVAWEDLLTDMHDYPRVPHTAPILASLRSRSGPLPIFLSEYGIGSAVDYWRVTRQFERIGKTYVEDAHFYRDKLDRYLADYKRWKLDEVYARPEDFFAESLRKMAGQRALGLNAIRANPHIVGYSLTGMNDHVSCGEGLTTTFRELKPGTVDAMFEGFAPLKWCLSAEPANLYRGSKVHVEVVLSDEDALAAGEYPVRVQVVGPGNEKVLDRIVPLRVGGASAKEVPFARPVFAGDVTVDGPPGKYRLLATMERGAAPTGGEIEFYADDAAAMPAVKAEVVLWGDDPALAAWLAGHGIRTRPFADELAGAREVILVSKTPPPGGDAPFAALARHVARGSSAVFLSTDVFKKGNQPLGYLPLVNKGTPAAIAGWLYLKDEWAKRHPIFDGLPAGGLMDYTFYREIIPDAVLVGQDTPAEAVAGAIKASQDYSSGLMVAKYDFGAGRFVLNTLLIRENLGSHPAAERLLRNLLNDASRGADRPPAELPADFVAQIKAIGYAER